MIMMKMTTFIAAAMSMLLTGLISCGGVSQDDFDAVKAENDKLKQEIQDLKFGPEKMLSQAQIYIEDQDFVKAKSELKSLIEKHSTTEQATEAKQLLVMAENGISAQKLAEEQLRIEKEKADKERLSNATKKLRSQYDEMNGVTWYYDKSTPQYTNYNSFHLYMGQKEGGKPWLRFRIQYTADDWLFIESFVIKTDYTSHTISTSYGQVETDHGSGKIWEWYDVKMDNRLYSIVIEIIESKSVKLRCNGKQYYKDRTLSAKEKQGLQNVLDAYEALGGDKEF